MQFHTILPLLVLSASNLSSPPDVSLQDLADSLTLEPLTVESTTLKIPTLPGADVTLLGADYEQVIAPDGTIHRDHLLADLPVRVSFRVTKDGETACSKDYVVNVPVAPGTSEGGPKPDVIPALLQWRGGVGSYRLGSTISGDAFVAQEFVADVKDVFLVDMQVVPEDADASVQLRLIGTDKERADKTLKEVYTLDIKPDCAVISAYTPTGLYWGTRSLLQMLVSGKKGIAPCGQAYDIPRYALRGFMFDVGRLPVPLSEIEDVIRTMAWYKMNDLHLHLNDNYIFHEQYVDQGLDPFKESYSAFRLESNVKGADGTPLTAQDLFYTKDQFRALVRFANARGVNIVPEFDTPGHALSFTRVRPDLIYQGPMNHEKRRCEMLDASRPETLAFTSSVWDEYLRPADGQPAVFADCPVVHVGADEFFGDKEDYRKYADGILKHVLSRGYTPRIWGSLHAKPGTTPVIAKGVQVNIWSKGWALAWESIEQGYDIINTSDSALYIVPYAGYYRMDENQQDVYDNWLPNRVHDTLVPAGHPQLIGAAFAIWNDESDLKHNGYMVYDIWRKAFRDSFNVLGQKMWGTEELPRDYDTHCRVAALLGRAPQTHPLHRYVTAAKRPVSITNPTLPLQLDMGSLGPNYHLIMELTLDAVTPGEEQVLLDSPEGQLLAVMKDGTVGFRRADTMEFSFKEAKLPVGEPVKFELIGRRGQTQLVLNGEGAGKVMLKTRHDRTDGLRSTFILPLDRLGSSFHGTVKSLSVRPTAY